MVKRPSITYNVTILTLPKEGTIAIKTAVKDADKMKRIIKSSLEDDKALDIVTINLAGKTDIADYMVIATGTSQRHLSALADHIVEKLRAAGYGHASVEGKGQSSWVVVDTIRILVHLFRADTRVFYNLEKMWQVPSARDIAVQAQTV